MLSSGGDTQSPRRTSRATGRGFFSEAAFHLSCFRINGVRFHDTGKSRCLAPCFGKSGCLPGQCHAQRTIDSMIFASRTLTATRTSRATP
jgi:hypothetical protein